MGSCSGTDLLLVVDSHALTGFFFPLPHSVKGPELINMYVGQSEENVRNGEQMHPAAVWGKMGLFCGAGGKEGVLKPFFPTLIHSCQQGHEPNSPMPSLFPALLQLPLVLSLVLSPFSLVFLMGQQPFRDTDEPWGPLCWMLPVPVPTEALRHKHLMVVRQSAAGFHPELFPAGDIAGPVAVDCSSGSFSSVVLPPPSLRQSQSSCSLHYLL